MATPVSSSHWHWTENTGKKFNVVKFYNAGSFWNNDVTFGMSIMSGDQGMRITSYDWSASFMTHDWGMSNNPQKCETKTDNASVKC